MILIGRGLDLRIELRPKGKLENWSLQDEEKFGCAVFRVRAIEEGSANVRRVPKSEAVV